MCDEMLGLLSRWLRLAGYDVLYVRNMDDSEVIRYAVDEGRSVITRDRDLSRRLGGRAIPITGLTLDDQLKEFSNVMDVSGSLARSARCTICNGVLKALGRDDLDREGQEKIPPRVLEVQDTYYMCTICGHFYWRGTHIDGIEEKLSRYGMVFLPPVKEQNIL